MPDRALDFQDEIQRARTASGPQLENLLYHRAPEILEALLENPLLGEQHRTILLSRKDLPRAIVTRIAQNREWMKSYPLKLAVVKHPHAPRRLALPLLRFLYLFDLMAVAASPGTPAELRRLAEETILSQREGIALGQRLALARQGTRRIAAGLLRDSDRRVIEAALSNPALTPQELAGTLLREKTNSELTAAVVHHPRWSSSSPVRLALLRTGYLSLARALKILSELPTADLEDLKEDPRVAASLRSYVARMLKTHRSRASRQRDSARSQ